MTFASRSVVVVTLVLVACCAEAVAEPSACAYTTGYAYDMRFGQYIGLPANNWLNHRNFTMSFWFYPYTTAAAWSGIIGSTWDSGVWEENEGWQVFWDAKTIAFLVGPNFDNSLSIPVTPMKWVHIAGTFSADLNNGTATVYKNGVLYDRKRNFGMGIVSLQPFFVGRFLDNNEDLRASCRMDEISVWNRPLTEAEVAFIAAHQLTGDEEGLQLYYVADGDNATHAIDHGPYKRHGTLNNGWLKDLEPFRFAPDCKGCFNESSSRCGPWDTAEDDCADNVTTGNEECIDEMDDSCTDCMCDNGTEPRNGGCIDTNIPRCDIEKVTACSAFSFYTRCDLLKIHGVDCLLNLHCTIEDLGANGFTPWYRCIEVCAANRSICFELLHGQELPYKDRTSCQDAGFCWCFDTCYITCSDCLEMCGNGLVDVGEQCDDGNNTDGDGCSANCTLETGWVCEIPGILCITNCSDGLTIANEACDDGNRIDGDGCSADCRTLETGFECNTSAIPTICTRIHVQSTSSDPGEKKPLGAGAIIGIVFGGIILFAVIGALIFALVYFGAALKRVKTTNGGSSISLGLLLNTHPSQEEFDPAASQFIAPEEFPVTATPSSLRFGLHAGKMAALEETLTENVTLSTTTTKYHFRVTCPHSIKYDLIAEPASGTVKPGLPVTVTCQISVRCTTRLNLELPLIISQQSLKKSDSTKLHTLLPIAIETKLSTRLDPDEINLIEPPIGDGSYGRVYRGTYRTQDVAVKVLKYQDVGQKADFEREVRIMEELRSPFVIGFIGAVVFDNRRALVTEFIPTGSLGALIRTQTIPYGLKVRACRDCARGMSYLHSSNIMHRDLKPDNLLMASLDENALVVAKLTDFGTTRETTEAVTRNLTVGIGTPIYMAPELLDSELGEYSMAADMYSFGMLMFALMSDKEPYSNGEFAKPWDIARFVIAGKRLTIPDHVPRVYSQLLQSAWQQDPKSRPSFEVAAKTLEDIIEELHPDGQIARDKKSSTALLNSQSSPLSSTLATSVSASLPPSTAS